MSPKQMPASPYQVLKGTDALGARSFPLPGSPIPFQIFGHNPIHAQAA
jgi:hypothetical protein